MRRFKLAVSLLVLTSGALAACMISDPDRSASAPPQACGVPPDCEDI